MIKNRPIDLSVLSDIRNKLNLITQIPSFLPLDSAPASEDTYAVPLTDVERAHINELSQSCVFIETKLETTTI